MTHKQPEVTHVERIVAQAHLEFVPKEVAMKLREAQELTQQQVNATQGLLACKLDKVRVGAHAFHITRQHPDVYDLW